jgi:hypothetical protein
MAKEVSIRRMRAEQEARGPGVLFWFQSVLIFLLLIGMAEDYNHDQYFQAWAGTHLGGLGFLMAGTFAAFYAGILTAIFLKGPLPHTISKRIRRKEPVVPNSVLRFYDEIDSLTSEPRSR